jgi:mycobactin peptide synthetase MbtE
MQLDGSRTGARRTGLDEGLLDEGLHQILARLARRRPDAIAVIDAGNTTTYAELDRIADAWAAALVGEGVGPRAIVPVVLPRNRLLVTALLAVLKTGAAYSLLDPAWPARRVREVMDNLPSAVVVTDDSVAFAGTELRRWMPPSGLLVPPKGFRPAAVAGTDPCCAFFTSGTTGRPKGALTTHRATARLFPIDSFAAFDRDTIMPLAAPVAWDAFSLELWAALLNGGTSLVVDEPYLSVESLRRAVSDHGANTVWLTASLFNMIVDEDVEAFGGMRLVMTGGERLSVPHVTRFLRRHPTIALVNGYGPVESTIFATTHAITEADCASADGIPLGRPVPGTQIHVLDADRPCDLDETGEICIAGDGLALRYLGDPALTKSKFVRVDVGGRVTRVYRTGDLGRWGAGGLLRFGGRTDRQVKIRGHRVEPAEVERQIEELLDVRSCRVVARMIDGEPPKLLAFCVPRSEGDRLDGAIETLRCELASHHLPVAVLAVERFPLTPQGKLDEGVLLDMALDMAAARDVVEPEPDRPRPPAEAGDGFTEAVAAAFAEVLGKPAWSGVSFFDHGGDSLGAGRVCARLGLRTGRAVPLSRLYSHPTVEGLAGWLRASVAASSVAPNAAEVPLSPMQLVFLTRHLADPDDRTGHCLLMWVVEGDLDVQAMDAAITLVHERHDALRTAYITDPRPVARIVDVPPPPLEELPPAPTVEAALAATRDELAEELDPTCGDVWRVLLVPVAPGRAVLGCAFHHVAFDGRSESVLAADLGAAYSAARGMGAPPHGVVLSLAQAGSGRPDLEASDPTVLDELRNRLHDAPDVRWPAPGADIGGPPAMIEVLLDEAIVRGIDAAASSARVSRFVVLLTAFDAALAELTGQPDLVIGVPVRQRVGEAADRTVGCLINMVPIRVRCAEQSDRGNIAAVATAVHTAFAAQDVALADLLRILSRPSTRRPPLFQTVFVLQDNPVPDLPLAGARTTFIRPPYLDLPVELLAEVWPDDDGHLRLEISFRPEVVAEQTARDLTRSLANRLVNTAFESDE